MALKIALLMAFVAVSLARPDAPAPSYGYQEASEEQYAPAKYDFDWSVKDDESGNNYGHQESRDGDNTEGSYYVLLPDGRTQKVTYTVNGDSGFVAEVSYEGEAKFDEPEEYNAPEPQAYNPPQPQAKAPKPQAYKPPKPSKRYN